MSELPRLRMRLAIISLCVTLILTGIGLQTKTAAQSVSHNSVTLSRLTLIVNDIDRSINFYLRLGLLVQSDQSRTQRDAGGIILGDTFPLTDDPTLSRAVTMSNGQIDAAEITLLWYDRPPLPSARGNLMGLGTGDVVMTFQVNNIQTVYGQLESIGTRFHEPPLRFSERGLDGDQRSGLRFLAYDPNGHMIEVIQID